VILSDLKFRLRALLRKSAMERELDDELRFHIERETEKYVRHGMSRADAERHARVAFGGMERIKDDTRDARGITMLDSFAQDLRYAWRGLRSKPGFTIPVVLTLGLGIGANTAMFGIVDRLMFRPPAYLQTPERVHRVFLTYTWNGEERTERNFSYKRYLELSDLTTSFDLVAAMGYRRLAIGTGEAAKDMNVGAVSASLFEFFDARPALGRFFTRDEDKTPTGAHVAVLGYEFWQSRYGGSAGVLGQSFHVGDQIYTVIGVAPPGFTGVTEEGSPVAFVPITTFASSRGDRYFQSHNWSWLEMIARRKPAVSVAAANGDVSAAWARSWNLEAETGSSPRRNPPADSVRARAEVASLHLGRGPLADANAKIVTWVMGVAFIVLLVACANVGNLLLARAVKRRREIALRLALGVTRRRLLQQLLTESLMIALLGGVAGLATAQWGGRALRALFLGAEEFGAVVSDARTVLFAGAVTLGVALITGLAPVVQAMSDEVAESLKAGAREGTYRRSRLRTSLLLFQGALSVVLLVGAGLFVRSLSNVRTMRMGYDVAPLVYLEGNLRGTRLSDAEQNALSDRLLDAARTTPGATNASLTISVPFWSFEGRGAPIVAGVDSVAKLGRFNLQAGSPSYFATLGTRIVRGRGILEEDRANSAPVVIVNEAMASALWPGQDAIGKQMRLPGAQRPPMTVVGIAENTRAGRLQGNPEFWYYLPLEQYKAHFGTAYASIFVRVNGRAEEYLEPLRRSLQKQMPGAGYVTAVPLRQLLAPRQRSWELGATMFVAFGALALVLAAIGLYSVIAYAVAQRTHELGVRIALGAGVRDVLRMIVGQGVAFAVAGIAIGSVIALWAGRWVEPLLFAQSARDPMVFLTVAAVLLFVAIAATLRPAIRATRVDPTVALRAE
jgi:putative ABC transport system permease protein